jgi:NAD+ diphosphatase
MQPGKFNRVHVENHIKANGLSMNESGYWVLRANQQIVTAIKGGCDNIFPYGRASDFGNPQGVLQIGEWLGAPCYAAEVDNLSANISVELLPLRSLFSLLGVEASALAGRAVQLLDWQKNHCFCGRCGCKNVKKEGEFAQFCQACNLTVYPRISPAVMVLIQRGEELLLARSPRFKPGVFSALAGFVEAGETLEQCAIREVREEVGVEINHLRYFRSQSWPFPDSLMVAFFAEYVGGIITPEPAEIEAAGWFKRNALPPLPDPVSIARQLINASLQLGNFQEFP